MHHAIRIVFLTALLAITAVSPAWAGDLAGTWVLDLEASDSVDPILKAQGVSWMKRKAAASLQVTLTIAGSGNDLTIDTESSLSSRSETLTVDGETRTKQSDKGPAQVTHEWKGADLLSTATLPMKGGEGQFVTLRSVSSDGTTLTQTITMTQPDGTKHVVKRIFRKS